MVVAWITVLLYVSQLAFGLECWVGGPCDSFTSNCQSAPVNTTCATGELCLITVDRVTLQQTASCASQYQCSTLGSKQYSQDPLGNPLPQYSRVKCCGEDLCNNPILGVSNFGAPCSVRTDAATCLKDLKCGWCIESPEEQSCHTGNLDGSLQGCTGTWYFPVTDVETLSPPYIRPGNPASFECTDINTPTPTVELIVLYDASVPNTMSQFLPAFADNFETLGNGITYNVDPPASWSQPFRNLPLGPAGYSPRDYMTQPPTPIDTFAITALTLSSTTIEATEGPLTKRPVLSVLSSLPPSFASSGIHVAIIVTFSESYLPGDGAQFGIYTPNNGDTTLDTPPDVPSEFIGTGEDFISVQQLKTIALKNKLWPVFCVIKCDGFCAGYPDARPFYQNIVDELGFGSVVDCTGYLSLKQDTYDPIGTTNTLIEAVNNASQFPGVYFFGAGPEIIQGNDTATVFEAFVSQKSELLASNTDVEVGIGRWGYGTCSWTVTFNPQPIDCAGAVNGGSVFDSCGVCDGSDACSGSCSTEPGFIVDACGVCGGNGSSCSGCDVDGYSFDVCGVCGGTGTSCVGCDGVINSGKEFECGTCGEGCDEGFHPLGIAGIILIVIGLLLFLIVLLLSVWKKRQLDHEKRKQKKDQLYIEAKQRHIGGGSIA